ncbi:SusC/RagA family TonB-linked outer membrane protein [Leeuwenhoekiella marinoflava]|uniref:TonB-linked SusC/RagA family outer membrane protein n=2 Tax=Leeuwenhoekiella marinoflava TaxID=988 RepID=A0A4Q0PF82_9FLAO|nr:TonB-dependent receptor [Leeuwenhoekiella marinoflava]RXG25503.1 TonB-linked SusC/RagA family outer membrane protein [Leeuwenhoekiella marinoflava]SHF85162.1 TonB-linked outer membrane protein, SusC/RagA family [Leeuwenhoekiella marinoflava DSM 3653]
MNRKLQFSLSIIAMLFCYISFAQTKTVTGTVTDDQGLPLPGVNISVKGTSTGTQTDFDGNYSISANEGSRLVFSYLGFKNQEVSVTSTTTYNITLQASADELDEILVVGYGTQSKRTLTDNIVKLSAEDIDEVPVSNFQSALVGKAAGVQITQTNGKVEGGLNIRVRGATSISAGTQPLYVLDGIPLYNGDESNNGAPTNPLLSISPNEIESIEILKDASSAAIYGARGANGVVIITTKTGKEGKSEFSVNISHGSSEPTNKRDWLNSSQYIELFREAAVNAVGSSFNDEAEAIAYIEDQFDFLAAGTDWRNNAVNTDWQDLAFQNGHVSDADFSMSGGNAKTSIFFAGSLNETRGIIRGNELRRFNGRTNINHKFSERFNIGMNLSYSRTDIDRIANDNAFVNPLQGIAQPHISPAYNEDGSPNANTIYPNFLLQEENAFYKTIIKRVNGRTFGDYEILDGLKINGNFAYDLYYQTEDNFTGRNAPFQSTNGEVFASSVNAENYIVSGFLSYDKQLGDLNTLSIVAGTELNETTRRYESVTANQFPSDDFQTVDGGADIVAGRGNRSANSFFSLFARATYDYANKYLLKASIRRDGSSRFGGNERYGVFPAFSAGWVVSEENFLQDSDLLSYLKLRGSWGKTGNAEIGDFSSRYLFAAISYNQRPGISLSQPGNPDLTWETTTQTDFGIEYGFFNGRISGEIDYYHKNTDGLLFDVPLIPSSGASSISSNIGELENKGFEFVLNTDNIQTENFQWSTSLNLAYNKNEILSLPNSNNDIVNGQNIQRVGEPVNALYMIEYAGVDPANGDALYFINSENPDGSLSKETTTNANSANRIVVGNPFPEWYGGITNTINFMDIDFSFTFQGEFGASIYNGGGRFQSASADYFDNQTLDQFTDRWQQPGDITDVPQARLFGGNGTAQSTRYLDESDFIRLRNATLGYSLPEGVIERYGLSKVRIYATGVNLLTFTDYEGYDPEARSDAGGVGQAFYSVPPARTFSVGLNVKF